MTITQKRKLTKEQVLAYVRRVQRVFEVRPGVWRANKLVKNHRCCVFGGATVLYLKDIEQPVDARHVGRAFLAVADAIPYAVYHAIVYANDFADNGKEAAQRIDAVLKEYGA